ncbi:MAG: phytanoyl-CoA dioxygenase family protein [Chloroflexota bacterium]
MDTKTALADLGITEQTLTDEQRQALEKDGYFIVERYFSPEICAQIGAEFDRFQELEGELGGQEVHTEAGAPRLSNVLNKSTVFDVCLEIEPLIAGAYHLLGPEIKIHGFNIRDASPGQGHQRLHSDGPKIAPNSQDYRVVNSLILVDPFEKDNGPTRVVPGTHHGGDRPQDILDDPEAPYPGELKVTAPAGSVVVMNAHTWHGGTKNVSGARRRVLHLSYTRRDQPQQLMQRDFLTEPLYDRMSDAHRYLLDIA